MQTKTNLGKIRERILAVRALKISVAALFVFILGFTIVPVLIAEASAESTEVPIRWDTVSMVLDSDADDTSTEPGATGHGDVIFGNGTGIVPVENNLADGGTSYGRLMVTKKRIGIATSGTYFSVYLSMADSSNSLIMENTNLELEATDGTWATPATFGTNGGSGWGFAVPGTMIPSSEDSQTAPDFSSSIASSSILDQPIAYNTDGAATYYADSVWAAVPERNTPQLIWKETNNAHDNYGFGTYTVMNNGVQTQVVSPHSDQNDTRYKSFDIYYAVAVDTNVVAGTYSNQIVYTGIAAASSLDSVSYNLTRETKFGGENDTQKLRFDLNDSAASVTQNLITVALVPHETFVKNGYTVDNLNLSDYDTCAVTSFTRDTVAGYSELTCTMPEETPETGYGNGTFDYWVNISGYNYNYISKIQNTVAGNTLNVGAFVYAGLQSQYATATVEVDDGNGGTDTVALDNRTGTIVKEMQEMTPGICDLTNMWKNTTSIDARIMDYNGLVELASSSTDSDVLGLGTFSLKDNRDQKDYLVRRLVDGNCWMVQNLDLELGDFVGTTNLNSTNTDLNTKSFWTPDSNVTSYVFENHYPAYIDKGLQWVDYSGGVLGTNTVYTDGEPTSPSWYVGNYYNWLAATAGTDTDDTTTRVDDSICPFGWNLSGATGDDLKNIVNTVRKHLTESGREPKAADWETAVMLRSLPISMIDSAWLGNKTASIDGVRIDLWTSYSGNSITLGREFISMKSSSLTWGWNGGHSKYYANPIRCVNKGSNQETVAKSCGNNKVCYDGNGADNATTAAMADETVTAAETPSETTKILTTPTYTRSGYAFAGWSTTPNGYGTIYGPNETVTVGDLSSGGLQLYAKWIKSSGTMQDFTATQCTNMKEHEVIALTDNRDGNTYSVAKLKDGNCWMTSNLALNLADFAGENPAKGYLTTENTDISASREDLESTDSGTMNVKRWDPSKSVNDIIANGKVTEDPGETRTIAAALDARQLTHDFTGYATLIFGQAQPKQFQSSTDTMPTGWYWTSNVSDDGDFTSVERVTNRYAAIPRSYQYDSVLSGGLYNWFAATAESGKYGTVSGFASDSVCPNGWKLPQDISASDSWSHLFVDTYNYTSYPYNDASEGVEKIRQLPFAFIGAGNYGPLNPYPSENYTYGLYWSSSPSVSELAARELYYDRYNVLHVTHYTQKANGSSLRCLLRLK